MMPRTVRVAQHGETALWDPSRASPKRKGDGPVPNHRPQLPYESRHPQPIQDAGALCLQEKENRMKKQMPFLNWIEYHYGVPCQGTFFSHVDRDGTQSPPLFSFPACS